MQLASGSRGFTLSMNCRINGAAQLNFDPALGEVKAPLVMWGPYLWARGNSPRKLDGMVWSENECARIDCIPTKRGPGELRRSC
jgi:hypothetical protein